MINTHRTAVKTTEGTAHDAHHWPTADTGDALVDRPGVGGFSSVPLPTSSPRLLSPAPTPLSGSSPAFQVRRQGVALALDGC